MKRPVLAATLACLAFSVAADPVRCVDAKGKVTYMDSTMPGAEKCAPISNEMQIVPSTPTAPGSGTSSRPRPPNEREAALKAAQDELAQAQRQLAEQEAIRTGDEKNYQRVLDRLKPYQEAVERAQQNVDNAQRNLR